MASDKDKPPITQSSNSNEPPSALERLGYVPTGQGHKTASDDIGLSGKTVRDSLEDAFEEHRAKESEIKPSDLNSPPDGGHEHLPSGWTEAVPTILFGFYGFAFAFEAVVHMNARDWTLAVLDTGACILCAGVAIAWWKRRDWLPQRLSTTIAQTVTDVRWLLASLIVLLLASALMPLAEQGRWLWQLASGKQNEMEKERQESIATATAFIQAQLDSANRQLQEQRERAKLLLPPEETISGVQATKELKTLRDQVDELKRQNDALRRAAPPSSTPDMSSARIVSLMRTLQQSYEANLFQNGDKTQRYLIITSPPEQKEFRQKLGEIIELALKPHVLILEAPDSNRDLDSPKLPTPSVNGLVTHGIDRVSGVLDSVLAQCFVMRRERADAPTELGDYYYPNQHPKIIWLAIGSAGTPWKDDSGCR